MINTIRNTASRALLTGAAAALLFLLNPEPAAAQSGEEILKRMEENQVYDTSRSEGTMIIRDRGNTRTKEFIVYTRGSEETLMEFTNPEDRDQKYLRTGDEIYLYDRDANRPQRLSRSASLFDSDLSYEDMAGDRTLLDDYRVTLEGTGSAQGREAYRLELMAKGRRAPYYRQVILVDRERYVLLQASYYSRSGDLLKTLDVKEVERLDDTWVPVRFVMSDKTKRNSSTEVMLDDMQINLEFRRDPFSLEELTW